MARRFQDDDDDYDDRPRKRRPADDDVDDMDDRVSSRKRPGARARGDDYDDEDDFDRPRKKKKAGSKGLIIGLSVGGGVLVLAIVGLVLFFVLKGGSGDTQKLLVGTWQLEGGIPATATFTADGNLTQDVAGMRIQCKYKVINATTVEIEMNPLAGLGDLFKGMPQPPGGFPQPPGGLPNMNVKQTLTIQVSQNALTITEMGITKRYKRVN